MDSGIIDIYVLAVKITETKVCDVMTSVLEPSLDVVPVFRFAECPERRYACNALKDQSQDKCRNTDYEDYNISFLHISEPPCPKLSVEPDELPAGCDQEPYSEVQKASQEYHVVYQSKFQSVS